MYDKNVKMLVDMELERNATVRALVNAYHELSDADKALFHLAAGVSRDTASNSRERQSRAGSEKNMDKQSAIDMVNESLGYRLLDRGNTSFANVNVSKPVWWINISPDKFKSAQHILLVKENDGLIWLRIEGNSFSDLGKVFKVRQDNGRIDLEISSRHPKYMIDIKSGGTGYDFTKHVEHEW